MARPTPGPQTIRDIALALEKVERANRPNLELIFVNTDSGWRKVGKVEVSVKQGLIWLYEYREPQ